MTQNMSPLTPIFMFNPDLESGQMGHIQHNEDLY